MLGVGNPIIALLKFGQHDHMKSLVHRGLLYMNTTEYFRTLENDAGLRSDCNDSAIYAMQSAGCSLYMARNDECVEFPLVGAMLTGRGDYHQTNLFCLYALHSNKIGLIDEKNFKFGDACVVFTNVDIFLERVRSALKNAGLKYEENLVEYIDLDAFQGSLKLGPFKKKITYNYQSEFRIVVEAKIGKEYAIEIGDLSDVARIFPAKEVNTRFFAR